MEQFLNYHNLKFEELIEKNSRNKYLETKSYQKEYNYMKNILKEHISDEKKIDEISRKHAMTRIPPGTIGSLRGKEFNILMEKFAKFIKDNFHPELIIEREIKFDFLAEKSDLVISNGKRKLIIYNQLDFDKGGHQKNIADKYLCNNEMYEKLPENHFLVNFILRKPKLNTVITTGIKNKRLFMPSQLINVVDSFLYDKTTAMLLTFL